jgi:predicted DCC family thiol-disulfide oxidoreductase YuxK
MKKIILIDGYCNLCNGFIKLVYSQKPYLFYYKTINETGLLESEDSLGLQKGDLILRGPKAVISILGELGFFWRLVSYFLKILPSKFVKYFYNVIAQKRYMVFGKKNECSITERIDNKFIIKN